MAARANEIPARMIAVLAWAGRYSSWVLIAGLVLAAALPGFASAMRPLLAPLVALVLGLAIARLDVGVMLRLMVKPRQALALVLLIFVFMPITCLILVTVWRGFGGAESFTLFLIVTAAAPPISSATAMCLLLGYNARLALQMTLLSNLAVPVIAPLAFWLSGIDSPIAMGALGLRMALLILGGFAIGLGLQALLGKDRIAQNAQAFNGLSALVMVVFLFPMFAGVMDLVRANPSLAAAVLGFAVALNLIGNMAWRHLANRVTDDQTANALGLMYGNRNVSLYLAALPFNPLLGLFVAAAQIPMYATPAIFTPRRKRP